MHLMNHCRGTSPNGRTRRLTQLGLSVVLIPVWLAGCATTERAVRLVVDHHVGMARGAMDVLSGEAEAREQRIAKLQVALSATRTALAAEQDQNRMLELLKQHVSLQDALIAELAPAGGHQHGSQHADAHQNAEQLDNPHHESGGS
jgi:hypothetical protein